MEKVTTNKLQTLKSQHQKICMLTAYDYPFARILDNAGVDIILVGDSLGNVALGYRNTLPVTMQEMIIHTQAVARGVERAMVVADMPFGSYQKSADKALSNAIKLTKVGAEAVKIEGVEYFPAIKKMIKAGIPVMGHLGLTPQSIHKFGTYVVRATTEEEANKLLADAHILADSGCFAIVLEKIPAKLGEQVAKEVNIPVIGIGAGKNVDGQVLVLHDMLGITQEFSPRFLRRYHNLSEEVKGAVNSYIHDV
ncbi:MAG: 3-methyl-2-oxobutanoate hydroxymethyltransferase, partial [Candidatus Margulisbacteria bacterium]|nr:3-methyl-2-oxobutanoate hydroxymethyltransferase [Candidatus Margulisiibacteriota bacterium]